MNRQQRRALARIEGKSRAMVTPGTALANLADVAGKLQEFAAAGDQMTALADQLTEVLGQVQEARDAFATLLDETGDAKYEAERQRFVMLRLVGTVNPVDPTDVAALLALEQQYRNEYDGLQVLLAFIHLVQKQS